MANKAKPVVPAVDAIDSEFTNSEMSFDINEVLKDPKGRNFVDTSDNNSQQTYETMQELFVLGNLTRNVSLLFPHLSNQNKISWFLAAPLRQHNPRASKANRDSTVYVATNTDPIEYQTSDNRTAFDNSNKVMFTRFLTKALPKDPTLANSPMVNNPFNALLLTKAHFRLILVPTEINCDASVLNEINKPAYTLRAKLKELQAHNIQDAGVVRNKTTEFFVAYQNEMHALHDAGIVSIAQALVAERNSMKPIISMDSNYKSPNPFLNVETLLNGASEMTFMPVLNKVFGSFETSNADSFPRSDITLGKSALASDPSLFQTSKLAHVTDEYNNVSDVVVRIRDNRLLRGTNNGTSKSRVDALESIAARNQTIFGAGTLIPYVFQTGTQGKRNGLNLFTVMLDHYTVNNTISNNTAQDIDIESLMADGDVSSEVNIEEVDMFITTDVEATDEAVTTPGSDDSTDINEYV